MYPPQRGGYNISEPASYSCYQPTAPCGTKPPRQPKITLQGGKTFYVFLQQNLNHYNPGYTGFIDVGYAVGTNQTSDDQFVRLARISDYWAHFQGTQTNFSIPIHVPDIDCDWCTLQVRYHPNKPTEPIFHNCADVKIVPTTTKVTGFYVGLVKPGPAYAPTESYSKFVELDIKTGKIEEVIHANNHIGQRSMLSDPLFNVYNGMITQAAEGGVVFLGSDFITDYPPVDKLFHYSTGVNNFTSMSIPFPPTIVQWDGIISTFVDTVAPYILIGQTEDSSSSTYTFSAFWLSSNGVISSPIATSEPDSTYVNYFWSDFNPCAGAAGQVYVLVGDENSLTALNVKLFTFDIATSSVSSVLVDNSKFTMTSVHVWPEGDCNNLYSVSPGLVLEPSSKRIWSLVSIDPTTGSVSNPLQVSDPGEYTFYYGGGVYGKSVNDDSQLAHIFQRQIDGTFEIRLINLRTRSVDLITAIDLGVNSFFSLSSLTYFAQ